MLSRWAINAQEVLIQDFVPASASAGDGAGFCPNLAPDLDLVGLVCPEQPGLHSERAVGLEG